MTARDALALLKVAIQFLRIKPAEETGRAVKQTRERHKPPQQDTPKPTTREHRSLHPHHADPHRKRSRKPPKEGAHR